jgi:hypothetical protein
MKYFLSIFALSACVSSAHAAPVTYQFTGATLAPMNVNNGTSIGGLPAGTPYSGTLTFDDAQTVTPIAFYGGTHSTFAFSNLTLTVGTTTVSEGPGKIDLYDNVNPPNGIPPGDTLLVNTSGIQSEIATLSGPINGAQFNYVYLSLVDGTGTAFTDPAHLPSNLNFASFGTTKLLGFNYGTQGIPYGAGNTTTISFLSSLSKTGSTVTIPPTLTTTSLPNGIVGTAYSAGVTANAPNNDVVTLSIDPTSLPAGLTFDGANIVGTPTAVGTANVVITATDVVTRLSTSGTLPLVINDAAISFAPVSLPNAVTNAAYSASFATATGGSGNFTYAATGLPAGLTLTGTSITGIAPPTAGSYTFTLIATDSAGFSVSANMTLTVVDGVVACSGTNVVESSWVSATQRVGTTLVNVSRIVTYDSNGLPYLLWVANLNASNTTFLGGLTNWYQSGLILDYAGTDSGRGCDLTRLTIKPRVTVDTVSLPNATAGLAYSAPISVSWGATPYQSITVSGQPAGLIFDGANLVGSPSAVGTFSVTITAVDAVGASSTKTLALTVADQAINFAPSLPTGVVGSAYSANLSANGFGPFTYRASGLPAGLSLTGNIISGTPSTAGSATVTLIATDAAGVSSSATVTLTINPATSSGSYTILDESQGKITALGSDYIMVGTKKLIWDTKTTLIVNTPNGELNTVGSFVKVGMKVQWKGFRDKATNTVLTSKLEINWVRL